MKYLILAILLFSFGALADTADVTFEAPTEREDNTALLPSEIGAFNVYDNAGVKVMTLTGDTNAFSVPADGKTLYLTTVDTEGRESAYSEAVTIPLGKTDPKSPGSIIINIIIGGSG